MLQTLMPFIRMYSIAKAGSLQVNAVQRSSYALILNTSKHSFGNPTWSDRRCTSTRIALHCEQSLHPTCRLEIYHLQLPDLSVLPETANSTAILMDIRCAILKDLHSKPAASGCHRMNI